MKKLYYAAMAYAVIGLMTGLFYREYTKINDFTGDTELAVLHTHLLALGMIVMLVVLALEKLFLLSKTKYFNLFYWNYNIGLVLTAAMMLVIGIGQVSGQEASPMLAGLAGLGHMILTLAILFLFLAIGKRIDAIK